jgi:hypothetical protein
MANISAWRLERHKQGTRQRQKHKVFEQSFDAKAVYSLY